MLSAFRDLGNGSYCFDVSRLDGNAQISGYVFINKDGSVTYHPMPSVCNSSEISILSHVEYVVRELTSYLVDKKRH